MKTITLFRRKRQTKEGKNFFTYFTKMTNTETNEEEFFDVKFAEIEPPKEDYPLNIGIEKGDCNIVKKDEVYTTEDGEEKIAHIQILWVSSYIISPTVYVDTSTDNYF